MKTKVTTLNHFIEIEKGKSCYFLTVHSGSRNFGLRIAKYHQDKAKKINKKISKEEIEEIKSKFSGPDIEREIKALKKKKSFPTGLEALSDEYREEYLHHMRTAQRFASFNRKMMLYLIMKQFHLEMKYIIESVHNYIDFEDGIIRKGAISARRGKSLVIPLNMRDGIIIGKGKGNKEWNYSAPHGAGRRLSRSKAKEEIKMEDFQSVMEGIWSTSIMESTLDEAPQAYKPKEEILKVIGETIEIVEIAKPIYVIKA